MPRNLISPYTVTQTQTQRMRAEVRDTSAAGYILLSRRHMTSCLIKGESWSTGT